LYLATKGFLLELIAKFACLDNNFLSSTGFKLGVYSYKNQNTFCLFDTAKYKNNQLNNSSAHIHTMDLHKARKDGIFEKTDKQGNNIIVK
jgi:hypothetical protein